MSCSYDWLALLTVEDVVAGGLCGVVVLGEDPRQGPDDGRVNGEDVPQVFVQDRILQEEPAGIPSVLRYSENSTTGGDFLTGSFALTKQARPR